VDTLITVSISLLTAISTALVTYLLQSRSKKVDFKNAYYKIILDRRISAYEFLRNKGHDLNSLVKTIMNDFFKTKEIPALINDQDFINSDSEINKILDLLSSFGKQARYFNLNFITESDKDPHDVIDEWLQFETSILSTEEDLGGKSTSDFESQIRIRDHISFIIVGRIEKFIRAFCRQFTIGGLGENAKEFKIDISCFLSIDDAQFGQTKY
jgi:hypothetical protein